MKKLLISLCAAALAFAACQQAEDAPSLSLKSDATIEVPCEGGEVSVNFTTNQAWKISQTVGTDEWLHIQGDKEGVAGECTVTFKADPNEDTDVRESKVGVRVEGCEPVYVMVKQAEKGALEVKSSYAVSAKGGELSIPVSTNVDYTVTPSESWVKVVSTKAMADYTIKVEVEENLALEPRRCVLAIAGGALKFDVVLEQEAAAPYFETSTTQLYADVDEGEAEFTISTNVEYNVTFEEYEWGWLEFEDNNGACKFTYEASEEFDKRTGYVKFTIPAIQVDVLDANGKPTGETADKVVRVYLEQKGNAETLWAISMLDSDYESTGKSNSIAVSGNTLFLANENGAWAYDRTTGELIGTIELPDLNGLPLTGIAADDAGNIVVSVGGAYQKALYILRVKKADIDAGKFNHDVLAYCVNGVYGYGLDNIAAGGDVCGNGVVTMYNAGAPSYGGANRGAYWQISSGYAQWKDENDYKIAPPVWLIIDALTTKDMWKSRAAAISPAGNVVADGFLYGGYDASYNLNYYDTATSSWTAVYSKMGDWDKGIDSINAFEWNGTKYAAVMCRSYFAVWAVPTIAYVFDITDVKNPIKIVELPINNPDGYLWTESATDERAGAANTCVQPVVEADGSLSLIILDGSWGIIKCVNFPNKK